MDSLSGASIEKPESLSRRSFRLPRAMRKFYYGPARAVKATRQKTLDFHSEKRSYSQLDDPLQYRKDEKW
jgi:hypothetical protein